MPWIAITAWLAAGVLAAVILGFCAYELSWKARRLRADLARLQGLGDTLAELLDAADAAQQRLGRTGVS